MVRLYYEVMQAVEAAESNSRGGAIARRAGRTQDRTPPVRHPGISFGHRADKVADDMKVKANLIVVLFFFFYPLMLIYALACHREKVLKDGATCRTYLGLLVCWVMLWMPVILVYRLLTGSL